MTLVPHCTWRKLETRITVSFMMVLQIVIPTWVMYIRVFHISRNKKACLCFCPQSENIPTGDIIFRHIINEDGSSTETTYNVG